MFGAGCLGNFEPFGVFGYAVRPTATVAAPRLTHASEHSRHLSCTGDRAMPPELFTTRIDWASLVLAALIGVVGYLLLVLL